MIPNSLFNLFQYKNEIDQFLLDYLCITLIFIIGFVIGYYEKQDKE